MKARSLNLQHLFNSIFNLLERESIKSKQPQYMLASKSEIAPGDFQAPASIFIYISIFFFLSPA